MHGTPPDIIYKIRGADSALDVIRSLLTAERLQSTGTSASISLSERRSPRVNDEIFILIPGRTSRQGTSLNEGKFSADYVDETNTLFMCPADMKRLGFVNGERIRLRSEHGVVEMPCQGAKDGELPSGAFVLCPMAIPPAG